MMPDDSHQGPIALRHHDVSPLRDQFTHSVAISPHWVLLAALSGSFSFTLTPAAGTQYLGKTRGSLGGRCTAGTLVLCPPEAVMDRCLDEPTRWWFAEFDLVANDVEPWWPVGLVAVSDRQRLRSNIRHLEEGRAILRRPQYEYLRTHLVLDVLMLIGTEHRRAATAPDAEVARGTELLERLVSDPDASILDVATAVNLSPTQFTRRFGTTHGVPPIRYLTELCMSRAQRLLLDTDDTIAEIAEKCGYRCPFYFSRVFRRFTGQPPVDYRRTRRI